MICGAADEGSAALFVCVGARSWGWRTGGVVLICPEGESA